jgi:mannose-6-phosphate isomerase-like protein (cupin superfamily)
MNNKQDYNINLDIKFKPGELIDVPGMVAACTHPWFNQTLSRVNDSVVRLGIVQGEFHWHKHDSDDEFFLVLEGRLLLDMPDKTLELHPWQGATVPAGLMHRTRAEIKTVMVMIGTANIQPTGSTDK